MYRRVLGLVSAAIVVAAVSLIVSPLGALANPTDAPAGQLAFKFNYHAVPAGANPTCGSGAKVYTRIGATGHIVWELDTSTSGFTIEDCKTESLDGDYAWIVGDAADKYSVYVVLLGKNSNT